MLTIGSLFSGIGGLELGLEWAGLGPVVWQCEADAYCRSVLAEHWPNATRFRYVQTLTGPSDATSVDLVCGGFPCQDLSQANPGGQGLDGDRSGLWFAMRDTIARHRPRVVVVENVSRLVRRGLDRVVGDLVQLGYAVEGTRLRAEDVGAPHRRERLFLVAYADRGRCEVQRQPSQQGQRREQGPRRHEPVRRDGTGAMDDAAGVGLEGRQPQGAAGRADTGPAQPPLGGVPDGLRARLDTARWPALRGARQHDWEAPRVVAPGSRSRRPRLKALGNAVVPHCAYVVGMRIRQRLNL